MGKNKREAAIESATIINLTKASITFLREVPAGIKWEIFSVIQKNSETLISNFLSFQLLQEAKSKDS